MSLTTPVAHEAEDVIKGAVVALETIEAASGRLQKEEILAASRDNPVLRHIVKMTLNHDVYNIKLKEDIASSPTTLGVGESYDRFLTMAASLRDRKLTGKEAKLQVRHFLSTCHPRLRKWYVRILNKDLRVGVAKNLIASCFGADFLHGDEPAPIGDAGEDIGCMCAKAFNKAFTAKKPLLFPIAAEPKLDGERAQLFTIPATGAVHVYMRSGKTKPEIEGVKEYTDQVMAFARVLAKTAGYPEDTPMYLDGEFLAKDFNATSSVVSRTTNFDPQDFLRRVRTVLWDWAPLVDYKAESFALPWKRRKALLLVAAGLTKPRSQFTKISRNLYAVGHVILPNADAMDALYKKSLDSGFEGIMLKQLEAPHVFHRKHNYIVKLKPADPATGIIVEVLPGDGANGPALEERIQIVRSEFEKHGTVKDDGYFLSVVLDSAASAQELLRQLMEAAQDSVDRRLSVDKSVLSYRYSARMGRLVVECKGERVKIGTGFGCKAGKDDRMDMWRKREELIGMKVDFIEQATATATATSRHPRFKRLREDL